MKPNLKRKLAQETMVLMEAYTVTQAAETLNISRQAVHKRINKGQIRVVALYAGVSQIYIIPGSEIKRLEEEK